MKKLYILLTTILVVACFTACAEAESAEKTDKISIVTTVFPEYDWVRNILGDNPAGIELTMLLDSGVDLHSFQPNADDIMTIKACDLFIYIGGESDEWVEDTLATTGTKKVRALKLIDKLGDKARLEEEVEGMETEEEEEEECYDEHIWLSLSNAQVLTKEICNEIASIDPEHADVYQRNATAYIQKLSELDKAYRKAVDESQVKTLVFGDRFPFLYMTKDYGLTYYAAFSGCSAESEASFETILFLAGKLDELGLHSIITIEGTDHSIAETIVNTTEGKNQKLLSLDSLQSVTSKDVENGADYFAIMENNLSVLKEALQ